MKDSKPLLITTGDADGIGLEVTIKALKELPQNIQSEIYIYRSSDAPMSLVDQLPKQSNFIDLPRDDSPVDWVEEATKKCLATKAGALVTGPLSKTLIQSCGRRDIGHTDIFKRLSGVKDVFMTFFGDRFNVLLTTGHIPLGSVNQLVTKELLVSALQQATKLKKLCSTKQDLPIAVLGLNPHAGDDGLIGAEETQWINNTIDELRDQGFKLEGPLVPDAAFIPSNWNRYSLFVTLYHDQGLIPFKAVHGFESGIHYSAGLPFVRTSVDHGTAKDIFNKDCANSRSMLNAIVWADKLAKNYNQ